MTPSCLTIKTTGMVQFLFNCISNSLLKLAGLIALTIGLAYTLSIQSLASEARSPKSTETTYEMEGEAQTTPQNMSIEQLISALEVFSGTFNKRPDHPVYFSEKLLTLNQVHQYEKAIAFLKFKLAERQKTRFSTNAKYEKQ